MKIVGNNYRSIIVDLKRTSKLARAINLQTRFSDKPKSRIGEKFVTSKKTVKQRC
jgi:hypothetical protein